MSEIDPEILEQLAGTVERCGVPRSEFEISYEDYLQSEEIRVLSSSLSDTQIESLRRLERASPYPIVTFLSDKIAKRDRELSDDRHREESREWFRQRGLIDRVPIYDPAKEEPMQFARRLEEFCGIKPGSVFEMNEQLQIITPKMEWVGKSLRNGWFWQKIYGARHNRQFECLMRAISATNAADHGLWFGFIGNQACASEPPQE